MPLHVPTLAVAGRPKWRPISPCRQFESLLDSNITIKKALNDFKYFILIYLYYTMKLVLILILILVINCNIDIVIYIMILLFSTKSSQSNSDREFGFHRMVKLFFRSGKQQQYHHQRHQQQNKMFVFFLVMFYLNSLYSPYCAFLENHV